MINRQLLTTIALVAIISMTISGQNAYATTATISSAQVTSSNTVVITFSDPLDWVIGDFTDLNVDGNAKTIDSIAETAPSSTVTITFSGAGAVDGSSTGDIDIASITDGGSGNDFGGVTDQAITDGQAPVISLTGSSNIDIIRNVDTYSEPGATADTGETVVLSGDTNPDESASVGTIFTIDYDVTDSAGNVASTVQRTVTIIAGDSPVNTILGSNPETVEVTATYTDAGATCSDTEDTSIVPVVTGLPIDTSVPASFDVTYTCTDVSGNVDVDIRTVNVVDTTLPVITLTGANPQFIPLNGAYVELGATADDISDGTGLVVTDIDSSAVDTATLGDYSVTYDFQDSSGNDAPQVIRTVTVTPGNAPDLTVNGVGGTFPFGTGFTNPTSSCTDVEDGPITPVVTGSVNSQVAGSYTINYSCTDSSLNTVEQSITVTIQAKRTGDGGNKHLTAPTSGTAWDDDAKQLVKGGLTVDGKSFDITDNWWTPFKQIQINTGESHTFGVKTFAQNNGLMVQEFAFGIPRVGDYNDAEVLIEVWFNYDKSINDVVVKQDTPVFDVRSLKVSTSQVSCDGGASMCYYTEVTPTANEPMKDVVYAVKAIDMSRRTMSPHYFNDGIAIVGENLNPLATKQIPGTEKYEGLITITQMEKYSNLWTAEDGRIFEMNDAESFRLTNPTTKGEMNDRVSDGLKSWTLKNAMNVFDSSVIQSELPTSFGHEYSDMNKNDHRKILLGQLFETQ